MNTDRKVGRVLGERESEVMKIVWQSPNPISVRSVTENLQRKRNIAYTTIMTIMNRLVDKGLLSRTSEGKLYLYRPAISKDTFLTRVSRQIIKNFSVRFGDAAIAHFAEEAEKLAPREETELSKLLKRIRGK